MAEGDRAGLEGRQGHQALRLGHRTTADRLQVVPPGPGLSAIWQPTSSWAWWRMTRPRRYWITSRRGWGADRLAERRPVLWPSFGRGVSQGKSPPRRLCFEADAHFRGPGGVGGGPGRGEPGTKLAPGIALVLQQPQRFVQPAVVVCHRPGGQAVQDEA